MDSKWLFLMDSNNTAKTLLNESVFLPLPKSELLFLKETIMKEI